MGFIKDFKDFALKGNVVDLAVAVIIGGAFGAIVSSLVDDVITPLLLTPALKAAHAENLDQLTWRCKIWQVSFGDHQIFDHCIYPLHHYQGHEKLPEKRSRRSCRSFFYR